MLRAAAFLVLLAMLLAVQTTRPHTADAAGTGPTAVDDSATVPAGSSGTLAGATNDRSGSAALRPALTVFPTEGQPSKSVVSNGGRKIDVVGHGTFVVNPGDGSVTFTGWTGLSGDVSVRYRIVDTAGATDDGTLSVVVTAGGQLEDVQTGAGAEVPVVDLLANDTPGRNADGTLGTLDRGSVRFDSDQLSDVTVSDDGRTVTALAFGGVAPVGVATIDDHGLLTFRASSSSPDSSESTDVYYTARDTTVAADGTRQHHS
ncbi:MAG: Ig-like domain-containing protein, partial [Janthinobacterium lividum]